MTTTPSSTESSWIDVSSEASASPFHAIAAVTTTATTAPSSTSASASAASFAEVRQLGLQSVEQQKLLLLQDAQRDRGMQDFESDPGSPISPNSAIFETSSCSLMDAMLLNREDLIERSRRISSDWLWDWTVGQCDSVIPPASANDWRLSMQQQQQKKLSLRQWAIRRGLFSKEILSIFLMSNIVSLILGAGIGYTFLIRRSL